MLVNIISGIEFSDNVNYAKLHIDEKYSSFSEKNDGFFPFFGIKMYLAHYIRDKI